jgi:hypothetical protein
MRALGILSAGAAMLACSDDGDGRPADRMADASSPLDAAPRDDAMFYFPDRFCTTWDTDVNRAVVMLLPEPLTSQCAAYGPDRPANPSRGAVSLDGGTLDFSKLPDFVSVESLARGGYASKFALFCNNCMLTYEVYDESLETVIGRVSPGTGYVGF